MSAANNDTVKKFKVPHTYVILFIIIVLATIGTYFIPAGVYERVKDAATGRTIVDVASYHNVDDQGREHRFLRLYYGWLFHHDAGDGGH